jgi:hypothetical protein
VAVQPGAAAVLSMGASFDPNLTGTENAVTAAVVAGLSPGEARERLPAMLDFAELRTGGTSVLLASHSHDQVIEQCDTALWLQDGAVRRSGDPAEVVEAYRDAMHAETAERTPEAPGEGGALRLQENRFGSQEATIEGWYAHELVIPGTRHGEGVFRPAGRRWRVD